MELIAIFVYKIRFRQPVTTLSNSSLKIRRQSFVLLFLNQYHPKLKAITTMIKQR